MFLKFLFVACLGVGFFGTAQSCVRGDLEDRTPEEVFKKSRTMAKELKGSSAVGMVTNGNNVSSAVLLDSKHVLTVAHTGFLHGSLNNVFFTNYTAFGWMGEAMNQGTVHSSEKAEASRVKRVHIHPTFKLLRPDPMVFDLSKILEYIREGKNDDSFLRSYHFEGVDLAVLELEKPFGCVDKFPRIYMEDYNVVNGVYGVAFGYGPQRINQVDEPSLLAVDSREGKIFQRHVISSKVSFNQRNGVLFGSYRTNWGNGDESFIPEQGMRKTEGLPVAGDSGGPLFLEVGDSSTLFLAGITSCNMTHSPLIKDQAARALLQGAPSTDLYPVFTAVGPNMDWIMSVLDA